MIDNYLDFVKVKREHSLYEARRAQYMARNNVGEWTEGFYRGMALAFDFESRHWRALQKDIEALDAQGMTLKAVGRMVPERQIKLS